MDWLLAGPIATPEDVRNELLHNKTNRTKTLVVLVVGSLLLATCAAVLTGAAWAYAWMLTEIALGGLRIRIMIREMARAKADRRYIPNVTPVWAGMASVILISAGCYQCVGSGILPLAMMAGIGLANLVAGIASRNVRTPRYGILQMSILAIPFALATILSPVPFLFLVGLQTPLYTAGMILLLLENHKVLLDLHRSEASNRRMALHDQLTGLPNRAFKRRLFVELLDGPWPPADSPVAKLTVLCVDLDGFKCVNDKLGHTAGDAVLVAVADRLRTSVRGEDHVCRIGGDEFVVMLSNISDDEAASIAARIVARVSEPFAFAPTARVGASVGLASAPRDGKTADELLRAADRAMYEAKRRGKGGFMVYAPVTDMPTQVPLVEAPALADHDAGFDATSDRMRSASAGVAGL